MSNSENAAERDLYIYLSGSVQKGKSDSNDCFWTENDQDEIASAVPGKNIIFLDPSKRTDDLSDSWATFGRDLFQVYCSDFIVVDARQKRGLGVGAEMIFAKTHNIPVVAIAPSNSHYVRSNFSYLGQDIGDWIHPFILGPSDGLVESTAAAGAWIAQSIRQGLRVKNQDDLFEAMKHYLKTQLEGDYPMNELAESEHLSKIMKNISQ